MYLDYLLLGILSLAMFIWAYVKRPDDGPPPDDDSGGGPPRSGDAIPVDTPPGLVINLPSDPDRTKTPDVPVQS